MKLEKITPDTRNYGIDLLRVVSMFFVIILHSLGQGGVLRNTIIGSTQYKAAWLLEIIAFCAVDIFALISGYVSVTDKEEPIKYNKYIELWFQVVFYSLLIIYFFDIMDSSLVNNTDYLKTLFPVIAHFRPAGNLYWYFTAYTGLFMIKPLLDKAINKCSTSTMKKIFIVIIAVFSIIDVFTQKFALIEGYSFIWITLLYILGAAIKKGKIGEKIKNYQIILGIVILIAITFISKLYGPDNIEVIKNIFDININKDTLISYISPTVLGMAILYVIIFSRIKTNNVMKKIIKFFSVSAFSVFLLNTHYLVWENYMTDLFANIAMDYTIKVLGTVILFSLIFTLSAMIVDKIRILLFKLLRVKEFAIYISNILNKLVTKISKEI